jgi:glycine betaine/choline ABC-type transport system substrate-binding protein
LVRGDVDVVAAYSSEGRLAALDLVLLTDRQHVMLPYDAILLARPGFQKDHPNISMALRNLRGAINLRQMQQLNLLVESQTASPQQAAHQFLSSRVYGKRNFP